MYQSIRSHLLLLASLAPIALLGACGDADGRNTNVATAQSCMLCHNGSQHNDYAGPGMENPHPFTGVPLAPLPLHSNADRPDVVAPLTAGQRKPLDCRRSRGQNEQTRGQYPPKPVPGT